MHVKSRRFFLVYVLKTEKYLQRIYHNMYQSNRLYNYISHIPYMFRVHCIQSNVKHNS